MKRDNEKINKTKNGFLEKKYTKLTMLQVDVPRKREMKSEMKGT